jgi:tetratricopeptide (TPR) repeat protein
MSKKRYKKDLASKRHEDATVKPRTKFSHAAIIILVSLSLFFGMLEGGLALLGVKPISQTDDPFVGFASNVPLFVPAKGSEGRRIMHTAPNKTTKFNNQEFVLEKTPGTYRIFCLGGSTTYGRPYDDATSFSGWLRELLPEVDRNKNWEVINAGGISYASYRVAHLMEELVDYQPDLFVIYTGHNEFLEERTYRTLRSMPQLVMSAVSLLAHSRTWAMMASILPHAESNRKKETEGRDILAADVKTKLDQSIGPESYRRDDELRGRILEHYRLSLERMVALARKVDAKVIFVTPASNLKDCLPFKSEHTDGLDPATKKLSENMLAQARTAIRQRAWNKALPLLSQAVSVDPRHAELQYQRGKVLFTLNRINEAEAALRLARDEDVCPLRALTPMHRIVSDVSKNHGVDLVDYVALLEQRMQREYGHPIVGKEYFLDHVHPTIAGHKVLAVALTQTMVDMGLVEPVANWEEQAVAKVTAHIEEGVDQEVKSEALANLARVLLWAGKSEDAARLARQAMDTAGENPQIIMNAASILASLYQRQGYLALARRQLYVAIESSPSSVEPRLKLGDILSKRPFLQLDEAAANLLLVSRQSSNSDVAQQLFGQAMAWRGRPRIAYGSLKEALRLNPNNKEAQKLLAQISPILKKQTFSPQSHEISLDVYPDGGPHKLVQLMRDTGDQSVPDGISVEFYKNGRVKGLVDFDHGAKSGVEVIWDEDGRVLSRIVDRQGTPVDLERARRQLYAAIENKPYAVALRLQLGKALMNPPFLQMDEAAANLLLTCQQSPDSDVAQQLFGQVMARRARLEIAFGSLMQALRLNPENMAAKQTLSQISPILKKAPLNPEPLQILLEVYPSRAPHKLVQLGHDASGRSIPHGIEVEFHENGRVKRLIDYDHGVRDGLDMTWDADGRLRSVVVYMKGLAVSDRSGTGVKEEDS